MVDKYLTREERQSMVDRLVKEYPQFGEIVFASLPLDGSVQGGTRPVLIVQNDVGNKHSSTVEIIPLTTQIFKGRYMPTHVLINPDTSNNLRAKSILISENVLTIPKERLKQHIGFADDSTLIKLAKARMIQSPLPFSEVQL